MVKVCIKEKKNAEHVWKIHCICTQQKVLFCICFILCKGVMQLSFAVSMHKITCSISIPNSMRSRLSWNELTQLLHHRGKHRKSHHTHLWHKLTLCLSCALHKLKLCLKVASISIEWFNNSYPESASDNHGTHGRRQFLNCSGSSIWDSNPVVNSCTIWGMKG